MRCVIINYMNKNESSLINHDSSGKFAGLASLLNKFKKEQINFAPELIESLKKTDYEEKTIITIQKIKNHIDKIIILQKEIDEIEKTKKPADHIAATLSPLHSDTDLIALRLVELKSLGVDISVRKISVENMQMVSKELGFLLPENKENN